MDDLSSAHVYLRLPKGQELNDIPAETLEDCCQLVKANSIQGNKVDNLSIVYTLVSNLKKTTSMEVGQVQAKKSCDLPTATWPQSVFSPAMCHVPRHNALR